MSDRLTKEQIKRDEFVEAIERSSTFMEEHAKTLILIAVAVLVAVAAGVGFSWWKKSQTAKASTALTEALEVYRAPVGAAAASAPEGEESFPDEAARRTRAKELFTALGDDFGSTDAADVADVYLAQIAIDEGDTARARELWQDFIDDHSDHVLAGQVRVNMIHLDRQEGRSEEVAQRLEPMLTADPDDRELPADVVLWELAQTYDELERGDEAQETYRRLAEEYPTSAYSSEARQRLPQEAPQGGAMVPAGGFPGLG